MDIYIDVIFLENVIMNYLILIVTSKFSKRKTSNFRLFLASLIGALYVAVLIILPGMHVYYTVIAKIALSLAIIAIAFSPEKIGSFIRTLVIFYIVTFIFAGAAFAFLYFNQSGGFVRNGIVYVFLESKLTVVFLAVITAIIIIRIFWEMLQYRFIKEKLLLDLKIAFERNIITLAALVDTGNSLHDPLTNLPVVVVEFMAIKDLLPLEIRDIFVHSKENDLNTVMRVISGSQWISRFRLIPFTSLGRENGMLIGFRPDYIEIGSEDGKKGINNVIVGIYNKALSRNEKYRALLSPELIA